MPASSVRPRRDGADVAQDVLGVWPRATARRDAAQLALDELPVEVEERQPVRLDALLQDVGHERAERALRDRSAAQAGDDVEDGQWQAGEREADVLADDS